MKHRQIQLALAIYADLSPAEREQVDTHLQTCTECAARLASYHQMDQQFARMPAPKPDDRLVLEFHAALARTGNPYRASGRMRNWQQIPALARQVMPLAVLVLLVGFMWLSVWQRPFPPVAPIQAIKPTLIPSPTPMPTWQAESGATLDAQGAVLQVALAAGGDWVASGNDQARIELWHTGSGRSQRYWALPSFQVSALAVSANGQQVAAGSVDYTGYVSLWSADGREASRLEEPRTSVTSLAFSLDGTLLAAGTGADDGRVYLWQTSDQSLLHTLTVGQGMVTQVVFATDGTQLAVGTASGQVQVWQVADGRLLSQWSWADSIVTALTFSPDGEQLAVAQADGVVRLGPVAAETPLLLPKLSDDTPAAAISALAFIADGAAVATAAADGTVRLWQPGDIPTPLFETAVSAAVNTPIHLVFARNQLTIAVGSVDGSLQIWHINQN